MFGSCLVFLSCFHIDECSPTFTCPSSLHDFALSLLFSCRESYLSWRMDDDKRKRRPIILVLHFLFYCFLDKRYWYNKDTGSTVYLFICVILSIFISPRNFILNILKNVFTNKNSCPHLYTLVTLPTKTTLFIGERMTKLVILMRNIFNSVLFEFNSIFSILIYFSSCIFEKLLFCALLFYPTVSALKFDYSRYLKSRHVGTVGQFTASNLELILTMVEAL